MRSLSHALIGIVLVALSPSSARTPDTAVEAHLQALEQQWMEAVTKQDIPTLERILAPDFTLTVAVPDEPLDVTPRPDCLEACKGFHVIHSFKFHQFLVRVHGDVATAS